MNPGWQILKQQFLHAGLIFRLSSYEVKGKYMMHYFGVLWQLMNPLFQILIYWFVFGFGIRGGAPVNGTPFFLWLITGIVPWLFISPSVTQASNSIYSKINVVSKMKFPVSVLPAIKLMENTFTFIIMLGITFVILLLNGIFGGWYLLQLVYYFIALWFLLYALTLLLSTITTIIRDVQSLIQSIMRMMLFTLPIVWNVSTLPDFWQNVLKLNPFFYIIEGFRASFLGWSWFYEDAAYTVYFWSISILIFLIGSWVHVKFRDKFVDYL